MADKALTSSGFCISNVRRLVIHVEFVTVFGSPTPRAMQVTGACGIQQDRQRYIAIVFLSAFFLSAVSKQESLNHKILNRAFRTAGSISVQRLRISLYQTLSGSSMIFRITSLCFLWKLSLSNSSHQFMSLRTLVSEALSRYSRIAFPTIPVAYSFNVLFAMVNTSTVFCN